MKFRLSLFAFLWLGTSSGLLSQTSPGTFTLTGNMSLPRQSASATLISGCNCPADGKVLVAGGVIDGISQTTNTADLYDPATGKFVPTGTMNVARSGHAAVLLPGGKVLIVGAWNSPGPTDAEIYDPVAGTFSCVAGVDRATNYCNATLVHNSPALTATLLQNGKVLITGLRTPSSFGQPSNAAALYDPPQATFTCINGLSATPLVCNPSMSTTHKSGTATLLDDGTVLIAGGSDASAYTSSAEIYDPTIGPNGAFVATSSMLSARGFHAATLLRTGEVLIAGGTTGSINLGTAEVYANGGFTAVGNMGHVRLYPAATLLNDGTVLLVGGCCESSNLEMPYAEIYSPTSETFASTGDMNRARATHTATLLPNGRVLVAGGFFDLSAELYTPSPSPFLEFPLRALEPYSAEISSVFDHEVNIDADGAPLFYRNQAEVNGLIVDGPNGKVTAFTNEVGLKKCRLMHCKEGPASAPGYKNETGDPFRINGYYTGGGGCTEKGKPIDCKLWLFYDGHPGYDYPGILGTTEIFAPADGLLFIPSQDPITSRSDPQGAVKRFYIMAIDHGNGFSTWYLHVGRDAKTNGKDDPGEDFRLIGIGDPPRFVHRGDLIGRVGNGGLCPKKGRIKGDCKPTAGSAHLHFEVRLGLVMVEVSPGSFDFQCLLSDCKPVDPYGWSPPSTVPMPADPYEKVGVKNRRLWK